MTISHFITVHFITLAWSSFILAPSPDKWRSRPFDRPGSTTDSTSARTLFTGTLVLPRSLSWLTVEEGGIGSAHLANRERNPVDSRI